MGLYDRDYTRADFQSQFHHAPHMRMVFPRLTPVVKWLLIINVVVYFAQILGADMILLSAFAVRPEPLLSVLQVWRLVTYQFLHGSLLHILFNMLGLFFLGPTLERHWGSKRFLIFYLSCGVAGGVFYIVLVAFGWLAALPMIGASGAILGVLAACAILFPQFVVFFPFFPVPIRVAAIILILIYVASLLTRGSNAGGNAAHLAGMAAGATYVVSQSWRAKLKLKVQTGAWERKIAAERGLRVELDRILKKVHDSGVHSLTSKEKRILKRATEAERRRHEL
jgi:membrane associated rhomboid family serine protease